MATKMLYRNLNGREDVLWETLDGSKGIFSSSKDTGVKKAIIRLKINEWGKDFFQNQCIKIL